MARRTSFHRARSVLAAEVAAIRRRDPDFDAGDIAGFTLPLLIRVVGIAAIGVVPLLVIRAGATENSELVPVLASLALVIISASVVTWLLSVIISGLVVMILYRTRPAASSKLVMRILKEAFLRIDDSTSALMLIALLAGLLSLAFGLPTRVDDDLAHSVLEDLLTAQIGIFLVALGFAFIAESIRSAADIVDDQSLLLAWPWALVIACASWVLATFAGPFEATRMLEILLNEWLPAMVDDVPRSEVIEELAPPGARWWVALGPLPIIAGIWAYEGWRSGGLRRIRNLTEEPATPPLGTE